MKRAVVFDFGGVMTTSTMPERVRSVALVENIPWKVVTDGFHRYRHDYDSGNITLVEMYRQIWKDAALDISEETTGRIIAADRESWLYRNERTLEWMRSLKAEGRKIGILTNMAPDFAPLFKTHFADFIALADAMVISGLERMHKPERRIYDLLVERIALKPSELVFIDDVPENCQGARDAGWNAVQFTSNDQVEAEFREIKENDE